MRNFQKAVAALSLLLLLPSGLLARGHGGGYSYGSGSRSSGKSYSSGRSSSSKSSGYGSYGSYGGGGSGVKAIKTYDAAPAHHRSDYAVGVKRDSSGRIERRSKARHDFMKETGYPNGRPGYVIDHVVPLKRGGADAPSNMQWQTVEEAKAKDKVE